MRNKLNKMLSAFLPPLLALLMCGCTVFDVFSVDSLIRAPKLTGENASIQQAFEQSVGSAVSLVNPLFGSYRSAYVLFDYEHDGTDEAFVFYRRNDDPDEARLNILDCEDGKWFSISDTPGNGSEIYNVDFVNLDKDSDDELAVTWTLSDSKRSKTLSLYKVISETEKSSSKLLNQLTSIQIADYMVIDIDYDGQNEVFYTYSSIEGNKTQYNAALFKMEIETLLPLPLSDVAISKNIVQLLGYKSDIKDAVYTVYIDCMAEDGRYFTEMLSYDYSSNALVRPVDKNGVLLSEQTYRNDPVLCTDKNGDYMIDIPVQTEYEGSYYEDENSQSGGGIYLTEYMQLSDGELHVTARHYINYYCGYSIRVDDFWEKTYVVYNTASGATQFRLKNGSESEELLFTVFANDEKDDGERFFAGVTPLGKSMGFEAKTISSLIEEL